MNNLPDKIALVHDWFSRTSTGGAEKVVQTIDQYLSAIGLNADLFALVDNESINPKSWLFERNINTSFIQQLPFGVSHVQKYLPLLPLAIEQMDVSKYQLVLSSSHLVAKGILTSPDQCHLCYVHTPARYAWDQMHVYLRRSALAKSPLGAVIRLQLHLLRQWDQLSSLRVNHLLANSRFTARRISCYWGRKADVLHPPVNVDKFRYNFKREDFYLCACRLVPYKRVDLLLEAFNQLKLPLIIVGDGIEKNKLRRIAGPNVKFLGGVSDQKLVSLMGSCRAFVYPGLEDFGIAPVEAMAAGAPVIGLGQGGLLDTVRCVTSGVECPTGLLFPEQTVSSLKSAVGWFEDQMLWKKYSPESLRIWSEKFSPIAFKSRFDIKLREIWSAHKRACNTPSDYPASSLGLD